MTYKITRVIHPVFNGQKLEAEVELILTNSTTTGPNDSGDMPCNSIDAYKVLWITNEQGNMLWHIGNGKPAQGYISPELELAIDTEIGKIEDLEQDKDDSNE